MNERTPLVWSLGDLLASGEGPFICDELGVGFLARSATEIAGKIHNVLGELSGRADYCELVRRPIELHGLRLVCERPRYAGVVVHQPVG